MRRALLLFIVADLLASALALAIAGPAFLPKRLFHSTERVWLMNADGKATLAAESAHD